MQVEHSGAARGTFSPPTAGRYEFEIQAWVDRLASWRRDLRLRAKAGDDLEIEFEVGAQLLERITPEVPRRDRARLGDAVGQLRSVTCTERVRLTAALDDAVAAITSTVPDPDDLTTSERRALRVDRELAARGAWYEFFPRSEGGSPRGPILGPARGGGRSGVRRGVPAADPPGGDLAPQGRDNTLVAGPDDVGSPWAIGAAEGGHTTVHPDLGTLADLRRFVARGAELGVEVALDIAFQCSPDHPWVREHPSGSRTDPMARSATPRTRRRSTRTSTR